MNAGNDYTKAKAHAQANADRSGQAWQIHRYGGTWWIERYGTSPRGETTSRIEGSEIIEPRPHYAGCPATLDPPGRCLCNADRSGLEFSL